MTCITGSARTRKPECDQLEPHYHVEKLVRHHLMTTVFSLNKICLKAFFLHSKLKAISNKLI